MGAARHLAQAIDAAESSRCSAHAGLVRLAWALKPRSLLHTHVHMGIMLQGGLCLPSLLTRAADQARGAPSGLPPSLPEKQSENVLSVVLGLFITLVINHTSATMCTASWLTST